MRPLADTVTAWLARLLVRIYFSDVEVVGAPEQIPPGPTVLVANHQNGLVDGLVLMAALSRYPRFLGKSTLWKIVPLRPFLALAGVVRLYRAADGQGQLSGDQRAAGNDAAFAASRAVLAGGGLIAIFPEGISHDEASLQELRTGTARLALGAAEEGTDVVIVPVGLVYDDKSRFRSRALVRVGAPRPVRPYVRQPQAGESTDTHRAAQQLTAIIARDLSGLAPAYASPILAAQTARIADLMLAIPSRPDAAALGQRNQAAQRLAALADDPEQGDRLAQVAAATDRYLADVALLGLGDASLIHAGRPRRAGLLAWWAAKVAVGAPVAGAGMIIHSVPYALMRRLGRIPENQGMRSTVKLLGSFGLYSLLYTSIGLVVGRRKGWRRGLAAAGAAPISGWVAVRYGERVERIEGLRRGIRVVRTNGVASRRLLARRAQIVADAQVLLDPAPPTHPGESGTSPAASSPAATTQR